MKTLYIGHGYHVRTRSTVWFIEMLRKHSTHIDILTDPQSIGGAAVPVETILSENYDRIVVFQMTPIARALAKEVPEKLIFVPMYDASYALSHQVWSEMSRVRMLNFSRTLHDLHCSLGLQSLYVQYFPNPADYSVVSDFKDMRGFFWLRRENPGWPTIRKLGKKVLWSKFLLHNEPDPIGSRPKPPLRRFFRKLAELCRLRPSSSPMPSASDIKRFNIVISRWIDEKSHFDRMVAEANIFFASRRTEGIGMSFLEAMARGQCVVAPDQPTHSEYLVHGVSGLLYCAKSPAPLDFTNAAEMGAAAREAVEIGFRKWEVELNEQIPEFVFGKGRAGLRQKV